MVKDMPAVAAEVVTLFHRLWFPDRRTDAIRPSFRELKFAAQLVKEVGRDTMLAAIPVAVEAMRYAFPDAATFIGTERYIDAAIKRVMPYQHPRRRTRAEEYSAEIRTKMEEATKLAEADQQRRDQLAKVWGPIWDQLPDHRKDVIRQRVRSRVPEAMHNRFVSACHEELAKENGVQV